MTHTPPTVDELATGMDDRDLEGLKRSVDIGWRKFWAKRGGDPMAGTELGQNHAKRRAAIAAAKRAEADE